MAKSETVSLTIDKQTFTLNKRVFSSGKKGWGFYGKVYLEDGTQIQASVNLVIPHSEKGQE